MERSRANTASNEIASNLKGSDNNHNKGKSTNASSANGQQTTNSTHQTSIPTMTFTYGRPQSEGLIQYHTAGLTGEDEP